MRVFFDIRHLYYMPQYIPVYEKLNEEGVNCEFILYRQEDLNDVLLNYSDSHNLTYRCVNDCQQARDIYLGLKPDWIIFGNAFEDLKEILLSSFPLSVTFKFSISIVGLYNEFPLFLIIILSIDL